MGEKKKFFKTLNENQNPRTLDDTYEFHFGEFAKKITKQEVTKNLLSCIDVRFFGATYAGKTNVSIHGTTQINHGVNIWHENNIFSEQIMSPFRNPDEKSAEKQATTLGRQSKLQEGHYLHHFSVNPNNLTEVVKLAGNGAQSISENDITKLKEAMSRGVTWYDSASKSGSENEALIWITLKENSKLVLPNLTQLVDMKEEKEDGKVVLDCKKLQTKLADILVEIESVEIAYNKDSIKIENEPKNMIMSSL